MTQGIDHYKNLNVTPDATILELKKAFHRLAKEFHPDLNQGSPGCEQKFKQINESYSVLCDPKKRRLHDLERMKEKVWPKKSSHRPSPQRGKDILHVLSVSLKELLLGTTRVISFEKPISCTSCQGQGFETNAKFVVCEACDGAGQRKARGPLPFKRSCERCDGRGEIPGKVCKNCNGLGLASCQSSLSVDIQAGLYCGDRITLKGEGAQGRNGGTPGDLFIEIITPNSAAMSKLGDDLYLDRDVKMSELLLGGSLDLQEVGDDLRARILPLTKADSVLRIRERGFLNANKGKRGDLLVKLQVKVPLKMSQDEMLKVKTLADLNDEF